MLNVYKPDQGMLTRWIAFWSITALVVWGGIALYDWLVGTTDFARVLLFEQGPEGMLIPVIDQRLNWAFVCCWIVVLGGTLGVQKFILANPRNSDFLITTDEEVRKVTWPSWKDAYNSALVVLVFVAILAVFLVASDRVVEFLFGLAMKIA
ncbi:MAG: preprotein translocase subunit SecE [Planctomycetes bacterium]|nr:preprotein translocase subunit SecE [Planctomycetota bacterium]